jgi:excisionase family DNA binding protein
VNITDDTLVITPLGVFTRRELATARERERELGVGTNQPVSAQDIFEPRRLLTSREMADLLQTHDTSIEGLAKTGRIPSIRIGRLLRFEPAAVLTALRGNRVQS